MVIALVLFTLIVCIAVDYLRTRRTAQQPAAQPEAQAIPIATKMLERYLHPGHSWAMLEGTRSATVGADDIAQRFMAKLDRIEMLEKGAKVRQGEPLATLRQGRRALTLVSPLSGILTDTNSRLASEPSLLKDSPYDKGWIARIAPSDLRIELRNLLKGALAERWREGVQAQIAAWFSPRLGTAMLQDGGQWVEDLGSLVKDEEWDELAQMMFLIPPEQSNT